MQFRHDNHHAPMAWLSMRTVTFILFLPVLCVVMLLMAQPGYSAAHCDRGEVYLAFPDGVRGCCDRGTHAVACPGHPHTCMPRGKTCADKTGPSCTRGWHWNPASKLCER